MSFETFPSSHSQPQENPETSEVPDATKGSEGQLAETSEEKDVVLEELERSWSRWSKVIVKLQELQSERPAEAVAIASQIEDLKKAVDIVARDIEKRKQMTPQRIVEEGNPFSQEEEGADQIGESKQESVPEDVLRSAPSQEAGSVSVEK
jgi:hypothetical protein